MQTAILSTAYFPPIQYFSKLIAFPNIHIEAYENFLKQSYRNRCYILGSNGKTSLTVPVQKANSGLPIKNIKIDYTENWQKQHERTLLAAYGSSPFYEYYIDDFDFVFNEKIQTLWEFNSRILYVCCKLLQINPIIKETSAFKPKYSHDFRNSIHPKKNFQKPDNSFISVPYVQVFANKFSFQPNLSILDLLFNVGTESEIYLHNTIKNS